MFCPSFAVRSALSLERGRRESRVHAAPAVPCAMGREWRTRAYKCSGGTPAFPARWLYGLYVLALVRLCFCATIIRDRLWTSHGLATSIGAAGPHDFAVRLTCTRLCTFGVHRISTHVPDDAQRPSCRVRWAIVSIIRSSRKVQYFSGEGLRRRANQRSNVSGSAV